MKSTICTDGWSLLSDKRYLDVKGTAEARLVDRICNAAPGQRSAVLQIELRAFQVIDRLDASVHPGVQQSGDQYTDGLSGV